MDGRRSVAVLGAGSTIRERLAKGAEEHGDEDFSATYLTSTPRRDSA